ncbi:MAG TPA: Flp pilus assembly protein CpaB [Catenuloplanes sp.]
MKRRLLALLAALILAAVGCVAVLAYVKSADKRAVAGREAVWVLIATKRIPAGTSGAQIRTGGFTERVAMPAQTVPTGVFDAIDEQLAALAVTAEVQTSQLLLRGMFAEASRVSGGLVLPDGKLAVTVEVSAAGRVAGYVRPGSAVAVFNTFTMQEGKGRVPAGDGFAKKHEYNHATRVVLPRVEVIGVGERGAADAATSVPAAGATPASTAKPTAVKPGATMLVTVAVNQDEAERLIHVAQTGLLSLALLDDTAAIEPGPGVDNNSLFP